LSSFSLHISPEAKLCEERLACSIEGVEKDRLLVRFSRLDPMDEEREASFVIDIATDTYKGEYYYLHSLDNTYLVLVITSSPTLPSMPILVNTLNDSSDIYAFIRDVRAAYEHLVRSLLLLNT